LTALLAYCDLAWKMERLEKFAQTVLVRHSDITEDYVKITTFKGNGIVDTFL
jgi:hypothetical protein